MITVRTSIYTSNKSVETLLSRLGLDVEPVRELFTGSSVMSDKTVDTNRRWVGKVSEHEKAFEVIKPNPSMNFRILEGNFYNVFVLGRIYSEIGQSHRGEISDRRCGHAGISDGLSTSSSNLHFYFNG